MKLKEVIEYLQSFPDDCEVWEMKTNRFPRKSQGTLVDLQIAFMEPSNVISGVVVPYELESP